ncbi:hypothetical protein L7F22_027098 [Adiantum nelumboides]|nr:hypothetical protein [Adiantum nelumboides]
MAPQRQWAKCSPSPPKRRRPSHTSPHHNSRRDDKKQEKKKARKRTPSSTASSSSSSYESDGVDKEDQGKKKVRKTSPSSPSSSNSSSFEERDYATFEPSKRRGHRRSYAAWKRSSKLKKFKEGGKSISFLTYDGTFGAIDKVLAFIQQFNAAFGDEGFTESYKLHHLNMHFQKSARQWWSSLQANGEAPQTWKALRASIMKQFLATNAKDKVLTKWQSLKHSPYESIHKYVDKFWDLHLKATVFKKMVFGEQKQQFCAGLTKEMEELPPKRPEDHKIDLIPGSSPPKQPPYRVSLSQQEEIMKQVSELLEKGLVESLLDKDGFTLQELLDEDELVQECKALNTRLINFLRGKSQIQQLVKYVVEEPSEEFPFIACEIFTCEIEVILKTIVDNEQTMDLLFSFLDSNHSHGALLAGYFSKVVICLLTRKTTAVMRYLQAHNEILKKLVDLISITSIMEVLIRLVGADDTMHLFHEDSTHWLADTDLLEMLMDKLSPPNSSEAHANAADTLSVVSRLSQSELATKLSSPSFIARLFCLALEEQDSRTSLAHCLSVCISILEPKRYIMVGMGRLQQVPENRFQQVPDSQVTANLETIDGMLQRLGDLLKLLEVRADEKMLPTTYGELRPPLGPHRLKIVEFVAVLVRANSEAARQELVRLGAIQLILKLFFDYPFNNLLHHHVENIVSSCIESNCKLLIDHLLVECDLVARLLQVDANPFVVSSNSNNQPTVITSHKASPKVGNLGHLTRIANRLLSNTDIRVHLEGKPGWVKWQTEVLQSRNSIENVCGWTCGRPNTTRDRPIDSDDDDFREKDYDISTMASNLTREVFRYGFDNEDGDEELGIGERDDDVCAGTLLLFVCEG